MSREVRIAFVGVQRDDLRPLESALKNIFEKIVIGCQTFNWGHRIPNEYDRNDEYGNSREWQRVCMIIPREMGMTISLFVEQFEHIIKSRGPEVPWPERQNTFQIAIYEVVDGVVGRIKLLDKCSFYESAVGCDRIESPEELERKKTYMHHPENASTEWVDVVTKPIVASPEVRAQLQAMVDPGRVAKAKK